LDLGYGLCYVGVFCELLCICRVEVLALPSGLVGAEVGLLLHQEVPLIVLVGHAGLATHAFLDVDWYKVSFPPDLVLLVLCERFDFSLERRVKLCILVKRFSFGHEFC
jgi:hypothetical protein